MNEIQEVATSIFAAMSDKEKRGFFLLSHFDRFRYLEAQGLEDRQRMFSIGEEIEPASRLAYIASLKNPTFVCMTDKFMSGWGMADGRSNRYCICCETSDEVDQIERAAMRRPEMKRVSIVYSRPHSNRQQLISLRCFQELGEVWTGNCSR